MSKNHKTADSNSLQLSPEPLALSIAQFCAMTSLGRTFVYAEIKSGRLPVRRHGGRTVILMDDAKRYLRGETAGPADGMSRGGPVERAARQLRMTAYPEAGHAVASWAMERELGYHWCRISRV